MEANRPVDSLLRIIARLAGSKSASAPIKHNEDDLIKVFGNRFRNANNKVFEARWCRFWRIMMRLWCCL